MKRSPFLLLGTICLLLTGCLKKDVRNLPNSFVKCNVVSYSPISYDGLSFGNGMEKTFNTNGWVKTLKTAVAANFEFVDSIYYDMTYTTAGFTVNAAISVLKKHFIFDEANQLVRDPNSPDDEHYIINASFDGVKGQLQKISGNGGELPGSFSLTYNTSGRLLQFGNFKLEYDTKGNVSRVPAKDASHHGAMIYEYNYSKTATSQFYLTSGYNVHEYYNLAESCHWIPVQPKNIRTAQSISWGQNDNGEDYIAGDHSFSDHVIDAQGYLISYKSGFASTKVTNIWECKTWDLK